MTDSYTSDFEGFISKFADDTKIAKIVNNETAATEMQIIIDKLEQWSAQWGMPFNTNKCCIVHLGYHNKKFPYSLFSQNISTTAEHKDLGVMIDDSCRCDDKCAVCNSRKKSKSGLRKNKPSIYVLHKGHYVTNLQSICAPSS